MIERREPVTATPQRRERTQERRAHRGGRLDVVNKAGYVGRSGWLADAGLIKGGSASVQAAIKADGYTNEYEWGKAGGMTRFPKNDANWKDGQS